MGSAESLVQVGEAVVDGRLLKPETTRLMWTPVPLKGGKSTGYALGWGVNRLGSEVFMSTAEGSRARARIGSWRLACARR